MKAAVQKPKGKKIKLTIALIVKNEEKTLEKCLQSLAHLRKTISCELIIADTGSTDRSIEIAETYADEVFHFEWCDDFSAARNATIDHAKGEWYMYLDADEWFENTKEIETFLSTPVQTSEYMAYRVRNYGTMEGDTFADSISIRLFRITPERRFRGIIHEQPKVDADVGLLHDYVHHYGYVNVQKKTNRNRPLLLEILENDPFDRKARYQLIREYIGGEDYDKAIENADILLEQLSDDAPYTVIFRGVVYVLRMDALSHAHRYEKVLEYGEKFRERGDIERCCDIEMHEHMSYALSCLERYDEAIEELHEFFRLYRAFQEEKLNVQDIVLHYPSVVSPMGLAMAVHRYVLCCYHLKKYEDVLAATAWLSDDDYRKGPDGLIPMEFASIQTLGRYELVWPRYEQATHWKDKRRYEIMCWQIDELFLNAPEAWEPVGKMFVENAAEEDPFASLIQLRYLVFIGEDARTLCEKLLSACPADNRYGELLYFAYALYMDITPFILHADIDQVADMLTFLLKMHADADEVIRMYYEDTPAAQTLVELRWELSVLERTVLRKEAQTKEVFGGMISMTCTDEQRDDLVSPQLFERYVYDLGEYVSRVYLPEALQEENLPVLPRAYRFGLLMQQAYARRNGQDMVGFLRLLTKAGEVYPVMTPYIERYTKGIQAELDAANARQAEREALSKQVKEKIRELVDLGRYDTAGQLLMEYSKINPDDDEIASIYACISSPVQPS